MFQYQIHESLIDDRDLVRDCDLAIFLGSIGVVILSTGQAPSSRDSEGGLTTTLTQTAVLLSTDLVNLISTETASTTATINSDL